MSKFDPTQHYDEEQLGCYSREVESTLFGKATSNRLYTLVLDDVEGHGWWSFSCTTRYLHDGKWAGAKDDHSYLLLPDTLPSREIIRIAARNCVLPPRLTETA